MQSIENHNGRPIKHALVNTELLNRTKKDDLSGSSKLGILCTGLSGLISNIFNLLH